MGEEEKNVDVEKNRFYFRMEYRLHFEFVSSVSGLEKQEIPDEAGGSEWQGPAKVKT